ncbi:MAG TPA: hypothetical protein VFH45_05505 [Acidimicrobiales bacterium]|nr:hypothetical protein [Acidimicrobiales bacterium]
MPRTEPSFEDDGEVRSAVDRLSPDDLRAIVAMASERHEEVARAVRVAAARARSDLSQLRDEFDDLCAVRHLGYYESRRWADEAAPLVDEVRRLVSEDPSPELVDLVQRAAGRVARVILHADDSDGLIGDVARQLLELHAELCKAGVADPLKLARWMIKFGFDDQDFFEVDPVRYATALGETGLAAYRREVDKRRQAGDSSFAATYAEQRLAVLDGDTDALVRLLGGDLSAPYQFIRVAEAMAELGRDDEVVSWAERGIAATTGWQVAKLYDLAADVHERRGERDLLLELRRRQHRHMPSSHTYALLRHAAGGAWANERDAARSLLAEHDLGGLVDVLLSDGEPEAAWGVAVANREWDPGPARWMRLAEAREPLHPGESLEVYLRVADEELTVTGRPAYQRAAAVLKKAERAAASAGRSEQFAEHMAQVRERYRRRPALLTILDKARLV